MTLKAKIATGLITTFCSGIGTYELLRNRGGSSLTTDEEGEGEKESKETTDQKTEGKEEQAKSATEPKAEESATQSPKEPAPKGQTYREYLLSSNQKTVFVDENTEISVLKNILLHRMFPHYRQNFKYSPNQIFAGSKEIQFKVKEEKKGDKSLFIINKNEDADAKNLRETCMAALKEEKTEIKKDDPQIYRIKAWCTVPTIRDVIQRHKFVIPKNDSDWKKILESEWITQDQYKDKQSFFTAEDFTKLKGSDEKVKLQTLKDKCTASLNKSFERTNFPATKDFLGDKSADLFQETALFCTIPKTASDYIKDAMQGTTRDSIPDSYKKDYCYIDNKEASYYSNIKTTDTMEGKSFWCAVSMIYHKQDSRKK